MTSPAIKSPKKLIEVALPLDAINESSAAEKLIKVGKPTNLHLWWARRPLAAARAVIFAQLINDPASLWALQNPGEVPSVQQRGGFTQRRNYLFQLIADLVRWENTANEAILRLARREIRSSWRDVCLLNADHPEAATLFNPDNMPGFHDPFAGGGVLPLEAQRLGLDACASDLNPVAVLINKALIDVPPRFAEVVPVGPLTLGGQAVTGWSNSSGLSEDIRRYGHWVRDECARRLGRFYPVLNVSKERAQDRPDLHRFVGQRLTVLAWLWARTVKSPNPAFSHVHVPLVSTFVLSSKVDKEVSVRPMVRGDNYSFQVVVGAPSEAASEGTRAGKGGNFRCVLSGALIGTEYIKQEAQAGRIAQRLLAIVAESPKGRVYLSPTPEDEVVAGIERPESHADVEFFPLALGFRIGNYGMARWSDLFTARQLTALNTFVQVIREARMLVRSDAISMGMIVGSPLCEGGNGADAYADAVLLYLTLAMSRMADWGNSLTRWESKAQVPQQLFGRHAIPMTWDFCEPNPLSESTGSYAASIANIEASFKRTSSSYVTSGNAAQADARTQSYSIGRVVSTDPPYYDNIGYADLSDFFYVWIRPILREVFPELFVTLTVPKADELVATPARHGGPESAERFFIQGMTDVLINVARKAHPEPPITIYYAFKQSETTSSKGTSSTGWETFLDAICGAKLQITGTWPIRMENSSRMRGQESNALASSIVLVCRSRSEDAITTTRRQFIRELNAVLPQALDEMTMGAGEGRSPVAPVDLSQAMIGPGMAIFSKYSSVLEADGSPMTVKTALQLINRFLADDDFDADTQFCLRWLEQHGWDCGQFGEADVLARAKGTAVSGLVDAGVVHSEGGKVRLFKQAEYPADWDPKTDKRLPVWEALHQLIRSYRSDGERGAGVVLAAVKEKTESIRQLAGGLYTLCERRGEADAARGYNEIVTSWAAVERVAEAAPKPVKQPGLPGVN